MKDKFLISFFLLLILAACTAKEVIDFNDDGGIGDVGDGIVTNQIAPQGNMVASVIKPRLKASNQAFNVPVKPPVVNLNPVPENFAYAKFGNKIYTKPQSYWYSGLRKDKVIKKANRISSSKKRNFVSKIGLTVAEQNEKIESYKKAISILASKKLDGHNLSKKDKKWLSDLATMYDFKSFNPNSMKDINDLDTRVGIIPESLAIAQAAVESAWGSSRFAKQANNYFGQWCFTKGCGIVPSKRDNGKTHEVKVFKTPSEAVEAYIHNLNTHSAYKEFRIARKNLGTRVTGLELTNYLGRYSGVPGKYEKMLKSIIIKNNLD